MSDEKSAKAELKDEMLKQVKSPQFVVVALLFVVFELVIVFGIDTSSRREELQWHWLSLYFLILCGLTPITMDSKLFFRGGIADDATDTQSSALVGSSAFISWIFAKSITNASKKGGSYGICGGFGYAAWYLAFPSAAVACYQLRRKGYKSLPGAIHAKYGTCAVLVFACCVLYRLYNEVWSNSRVIADFYGRETKNYKLGGGTTETVDASDPWPSSPSSRSPVRDPVRRASNDDLRKFAKSYSHWGLFQWAASPRVLRPVLTDRCFLADPKTMARCFTVGGFAAAWFITLFSIIGVHGSMLGNSSGRARALAFLVPVLTCAALGICFRLSTAKDKHKELKYPGIAKNIDFSYLNVGEGVYRTYLGINILGACISLGAWFLFTFDWCWFVDEGDEFEPAQKALLVADEPSEDDVEMVKPPNPPSAAEEMSLAVGGRARTTSRRRRAAGRRA
ncbi:hypothetical protein JL721_4591 [Aureococcus anophagefferens]|nr:hypothetical protein JL721_4591 [Aureococcus anophagefferens]